MQAERKKIHVQENPIDYRELEKRYADKYKSAVSSSVVNANTKPLEKLISSIQQEEYGSHSFLHTLLSQAEYILEQCWYTTSLIQSNSQRKLKKNLRYLNKQVQQTDLQLNSLDDVLLQVDNQIRLYGVKLKEKKEEIVKKKKDLSTLGLLISRYKEVTKNSLDPKEESILAQGELDYAMKSEIIDHAKDTAQVMFSILQEYYTQKSHDYALKSVFLGNKLVLNSLYDRAELALQRAKEQNPVLLSARNKVAITHSYKMHDEDLEKENGYREVYNEATKHVPSYKTMAHDLMKKRRSMTSMKY